MILTLQHEKNDEIDQRQESLILPLPIFEKNEK